MVNTIKRLNANDCFDYFVNNFDAVYQNESTYRNNATLDPEITNNILYLNLKDHYVKTSTAIFENNDRQITVKKRLTEQICESFHLQLLFNYILT